ncbi:hypothetical protein D9619_003859 [Psilocybe cf. subviscida]|uniref:Uncharacterized protein n=1 Tax=Psilocybe cf. subviscida TaxID=2480587 RepID=A0A8H5AVT9_9AGAR|nr:hypothetical protein D9619_003859 [Psilocybe cf. subviscida]
MYSSMTCRSRYCPLLMTLDVENAALIALFVQSVLYGLFLFAFFLSCYYIWEQHRRHGDHRGANMKILLVLVTMVILASIHIGATMWRILDAFVWVPRDRTADVLGSIKTTAYLVRSGAYEVQTLVADGFMIYRLYMVWGRNRLICIPAVITQMGAFAATVGSLHQNVASAGNRSALFSPAQEAWNTAFVILTLFTNGYATGASFIHAKSPYAFLTGVREALIAGKIWYFQRKENEALKDPLCGNLGRTAAIVIESGAIYSVSLVVFIALYEVRSEGVDIMFNCLPHIIGIAFSLIIVRVAAGISHSVPLRNATEERHTNVSAIIFRHSLNGHRQPEAAFVQGFGER